ncbi:hypothetical protein D3C78_1277560 [compost metagenome]
MADLLRRIQATHAFTHQRWRVWHDAYNIQIVGQQLVKTADLNACGDRQHQFAAEIDLIAQRLADICHHLWLHRQYDDVCLACAGKVIAAANDAVVGSQRIAVFSRRRADADGFGRVTARHQAGDDCAGHVAGANEGNLTVLH